MSSNVMALIDDISSTASDFAEGTETETVTPQTALTAQPAYIVNEQAAQQAQSNQQWGWIVLIALIAIVLVILFRKG